MRKKIEVIYLAGPLESISKRQAFDWRRKAYDYLVSFGIVSLIPGQEQIKLSAKQIVELDATMIRNADAILVNLDFLTQGKKQLGTGTIAELGMAYVQEKIIIGFTNGKKFTQYKFVHGIVGKYFTNLNVALEEVRRMHI